jgi:hypothetical protein
VGGELVTEAGALRDRTATAVWLVAFGCALLLAVAALLVALRADPDGAVVGVVTEAADRLGLGLFSRDGAISTLGGDADGVRRALVGWGLGALAYLLAGKLLDRTIRP